jgi:hypothetical protein
MALLRIGGGHKDYDARYEADRVRDSVKHHASSI